MPGLFIIQLATLVAMDMGPIDSNRIICEAAFTEELCSTSCLPGNLHAAIFEHIGLGFEMALTSQNENLALNTMDEI